MSNEKLFWSVFWSIFIVWGMGGLLVSHQMFSRGEIPGLAGTIAVFIVMGAVSASPFLAGFCAVFVEFRFLYGSRKG